MFEYWPFANFEAGNYRCVRLTFYRETHDVVEFNADANGFTQRMIVVAGHQR